MSFQIKDFRSIVASMINISRAANSKITDYSVGSVARTLMEAPAIEIEELYLQMLLGLQEAIPTAIYKSFDFARKPAIAASGMVRFSCTVSGSPIQIPTQTAIKTDYSAQEYTTSGPATIVAGASYVDVLVICSTPGTVGNCPSGVLDTMVAPIDGVTAVTNPAALANGADEESDAARRIRFGAYIATLSRGTVESIRYGAALLALTNDAGEVTERAAHIAIVEPYLADPNNPVGLVHVYVHNGAGGTSENLIAQVP